jgi:molybdopterin-guanine dinucleotide biosynthesis protein A
MKYAMQKITGILLAGGRSTRMGREKGDIRIGRYPMYKYPLSILESLCDEILISTCKQMEMEEPHEQICDEFQGIGPIGGIYTCLKRSSNELNMILSYDLPLVNEGLFRELLKSADDFDITLPALHQGRPEPLCGIYKKSVTDVFHEMIENKIFAVHKALSRVKTNTIVVEESMSFFHPEIFLNINQESDLDQLPPHLGISFPNS